MSALWRCRFAAPADVAAELLHALDDGDGVSAYEDEDEPHSWWIELLCRGEPNRAVMTRRLRALGRRHGVERLTPQYEAVPETDWLAETARSFPPVSAGRFFVHGSHVAEPAPDGAVPILIDAGMAFGSGEHATTRGCLKALSRLGAVTRWRRVLDLGCGAGILAIAAAKLWPARVLASDIDPAAVAVAAANAERNGVAGRIRTLVSDGYAAPAIRAAGPFDLVLANILADPLTAMAPQLAKHLADDGFAVLSGITPEQAPAVLRAHRPHGLRLHAVIDEPGWPSLVLVPVGRPRAAEPRRRTERQRQPRFERLLRAHSGLSIRRHPRR